MAMTSAVAPSSYTPSTQELDDILTLTSAQSILEEGNAGRGTMAQARKTAQRVLDKYTPEQIQEIMSSPQMSAVQEEVRNKPWYKTVLPTKEQVKSAVKVAAIVGGGAVGLGLAAGAGAGAGAGGGAGAGAGGAGAAGTAAGTAGTVGTAGTAAGAGTAGGTLSTLGGIGSTIAGINKAIEDLPGTKEGITKGIQDLPGTREQAQGLLGAGAAYYAGEEQKRAAEAAAQQAKRVEPWYEAGRTALGAQSELMGLTGTPETQLAALQASPGYQFRRQLGERQLTSGLAARGGMGSGKASTAAQQWGQGFASQEYGNRLAQLGGLSSQGYMAGAGLGADLGNLELVKSQARLSGLAGIGDIAMGTTQPAKKKPGLYDISQF